MFRRMPATAAPALDQARDGRSDRLPALGIAALGLAMRLPFVTADEGWFDEHFSVYTAAQSVPDIVRRALEEQTNPPGYYLLAHAWNAIGGSGVPWHRLLSALCGALVGAVIFLAARRLRLSRPTATLAGVLTLASPFLWQMSIEIRAYATLALLTALALWMAAGIVDRDSAPTLRTLAPLAAVHVGMVLLHYFGALAVAGISLGTAAALRTDARVTWRDAARIVLTLGVPAAAAIAAWLWIASAWPGGLHGRNIAWIPDTTALEALRSVPTMLLAGLGTYGRHLSTALLLGGLGVAAVWAATAPLDALRRRAVARFILLAAAFPIALALALHLTAGRNLWVARYLSGFIPGLALVAALVVEALPRRLRSGVAVSIAAWWFVAGSLSFANRTPKPDWSQILAILAPDGRGTICADGSFVGLPFIFHARALGLTELHVVNPGVCRPGAGPTWLVYDVERTGVVAPPVVPGLVLGPRIALFRGMQSLDARRVIRRD